MQESIRPSDAVKPIAPGRNTPRRAEQAATYRSERSQGIRDGFPVAIECGSVPLRGVGGPQPQTTIPEARFTASRSARASELRATRAAKNPATIKPVKVTRKPVRSAESIIMDAIEAYRGDGRVGRIWDEDLSGAQRSAVTRKIKGLMGPSIWDADQDGRTRFVEFVNRCAYGLSVSFPEPTPSEPVTPPMGFSDAVAEDTAPIDPVADAEAQARRTADMIGLSEMETWQMIFSARDKAKAALRIAIPDPTPNPSEPVTPPMGFSDVPVAGPAPDSPGRRRFLASLEPTIFADVAFCLKHRRYMADGGVDVEDLRHLSIERWRGMSEEDQEDFADWLLAIDYQPGYADHGRLATDEGWDAFILECVTGSPIFPIYFPPGPAPSDDDDDDFVLADAIDGLGDEAFFPPSWVEDHQPSMMAWLAWINRDTPTDGGSGFSGEPTIVIGGTTYRYSLMEDGIILTHPEGRDHVIVDGACSCPDHHYRERECKHLRACRAAGLLPADTPGSDFPEPTPEDWADYYTNKPDDDEDTPSGEWDRREPEESTMPPSVPALVRPKQTTAYLASQAAFNDARRKARYGHKDWLAWQNGARCPWKVAVKTNESALLAARAVFEGGNAFIIEANHATLYKMGRGIAQVALNCIGAGHEWG